MGCKAISEKPQNKVCVQLKRAVIGLVWPPYQLAYGPLSMPPQCSSKHTMKTLVTNTSTTLPGE